MKRSFWIAVIATLGVIATMFTPAQGSDDPVLVGAGDIATCGETGDEDTAALLDAIDGTVFTAGDNAYGDGTVQEYQACYHPSWGRHRARTKPSPGNHERNGEGYLTYFEGILPVDHPFWYSYDLGSWHVVSLDSECGRSAVDRCGPSSDQLQWLRADLAATQQACIAAYWHHPRWSSGAHGSSTDTAAFWDALAEAGADLVLNGHDHNYERFAKQNPNGVADPAGIREIVVGTGGANTRPFDAPEVNSEVRVTDIHGVLKLTLHHGSYEWEFVTTDGGAVRDAGSDTCNGDNPSLPDTSIASGPPPQTSARDASFTFSGSPGDSTFECSLDAGPWGACTSPETYDDLALGDHSFRVRARTDGAVDPSPASWAWSILDGAGPDTTITRGPYRTTIESYATFRFTSSTPGATFTCRLDVGAWQACSSPHELSGLSAGEHLFEVRAQDGAGFVDLSPATWRWSVQPHAPSLITEVLCLLDRITQPDSPACIV